ncbi:MAG: myxococcus cysteine-rich repeat containing protein [bacterium]|nr:myxococcus cysteine-rich repeat containing protein [bacterium]
MKRFISLVSSILVVAFVLCGTHAFATNDCPMDPPLEIIDKTCAPEIPEQGVESVCTFSFKNVSGAPAVVSVVLEVFEDGASYGTTGGTYADFNFVVDEIRQFQISFTPVNAQALYEVAAYTYGPGWCNYTSCRGEECCPQPPPEEYCGDGIVNGDETCDDGNNVTGDGCSTNCCAEQHSVCYGIKHSETPVFGGAEVTLTDPLAGSVDFMVRRPKHFCNPVEKDHDGDVYPIVDEDAHAVIYPIKRAAGEPKFQKMFVTVSNQFGEQILYLVKEYFIMVPTAVVGTSWDTSHVDHYKCYKVRTKFDRLSVETSDPFFQLFDEETNVRKPMELCVPVEKDHGSVVTPVMDPSKNLVCYGMRQPGVSKGDLFEVEYTNQFEGTEVLPRKSSCSVPGRLCVPTALISTN